MHRNLASVLVVFFIMTTCWGQVPVHAKAAEGDALIHLRFDGDAADSGPRSLRTNTKGAVEFKQGKSGQAVYLDGKSGITINNNSALHVADRSFVVSFWIKPAKQPSDNVTMFSFGYGHGRIVDLSLLRSQQIRLTCSAGIADRVSVTTNDLSSKLYDGNWHKISALLDRERGGELRICIDDNLVATSNDLLSFPIQNEQQQLMATIGATAPWYIGKNGYHGWIDELTFYHGIPEELKVTGKPLTEFKPTPTPGRAPAALLPTAATSMKTAELLPNQTIIAVPRFADDSDYHAAGLLRDQLRRIYETKTGFDVINEMQVAEDENRFVLAIGKTAWSTEDDVATLKEHGIRIVRKGTSVVIRGESGKANVYAAVRFLDEFCSVRFYLPGELFTSLPSKREVRFNKIDIADSPYVLVCNSTGYHNVREEGPWQERMALNRREHSHQHNMYERFPPDAFAKRYPKIYPIINGKKHIPENRSDQRWQPTFSEPTLVDAAYESAVRFFEENPTATYIAFSVQDSHIHSDIDMQSPEVKEHGKVRGLSILYWRFMNNLASRLEKSHPDKKIVGLVYASVRVAPSFKLHPNVIAWIQHKHSDIDIDNAFRDPTPEDGDRMTIKAWCAIASTVGHHDWAQGSGFLIPRIYTNKIQTAFQTYDRLGAPMRYCHGEAYPNWGLDGPKLYMMAQLWWDPFINVDAKLRQFCDDMFGPAGSDMYAYFIQLENTYDNLNSSIERKLHRWWSQFDATPEQIAMLAEARSHIEKAKSHNLTADQRKRIELFSKTFRLSEMLVELANTKPFNTALATQIKDHVRVHIAPDPMTIYRASYKKQDLNESIQTVIDRIERDLKK